MLEITTCHISKMDRHRAEGTLVLDVTVKSAKGKARDLTPEWSWVNGYKDGRISKEEYTKLYQKKIRACHKRFPQRWENTLRNFKKVVFACYCRPGDFCHRIVLAAEFYAVAKELGIAATVVPEVDPPAEKKTGDGDTTSVIIEPRFAGVGSRETPQRVLNLMKEYSTLLANKGFILRSGGAKGADSACEAGCDAACGQKEIFYSGDVTDWALEMVQNYLPRGRNWNKYGKYVKGLLGRNMMQLLGYDGDTPVEFVLCWTKDGTDCGGTGYIIRAAQDKGIPVYNLRNVSEHSEFRKKILNL